ncbi:MAG: YwiC-like family protein [Chloroflexota bacterium]
MSTATSPASIPIKQVALPAEHGSWSLVIEPILLGLLVAPSVGGVALAVAAFALFLLLRPLSLVWRDMRRGRQFARTRVALRVSVVYALLALIGGLAALLIAGWRPLLPVIPALPLLAIFLWYNQQPGRSWQAELTAPVAFSAVATSIALAAGWSMRPALALWVVMSARSVPAILFVRSRLRLDKGKDIQPMGVILVHVLALLVVTAVVLGGLLPATSILAMGILLARAIWGLSPWRWRCTVKQLGFLETGFGLLTVLLIALGYWF